MEKAVLVVFPALLDLHGSKVLQGIENALTDALQFEIIDRTEKTFHADELTHYLSSRPSLKAADFVSPHGTPLTVYLLAGVSAISKLRTSIFQDNEILSTLYGGSQYFHAAASPHNSAADIRTFFPSTRPTIVPPSPAEISELMARLNPVLVQGLTSLCKEKPLAPIDSVVLAVLDLCVMLLRCAYLIQSSDSVSSLRWLANYFLEHNPNKPLTAV